MLLDSLLSTLTDDDDDEDDLELDDEELDSDDELLDEDLPPQGAKNVALRIGVSPVDATLPLDQLRFPFGLRVKPVRVPANIAFEPPELLIERDDVSAPPPVTTTIVGATQAVSAAQWIHLGRCQAGVEARVHFRVDGPIPPATQVTLAAPPGVQHVSFSPNTLRIGDQEIRLQIAATLAPSTPTSFAFVVDPPKQSGAVRFECPKPLVVDLTGPPPVQLVGTQGVLSKTVADNCTAAMLDLHPVLLGLIRPEPAVGLQASVGYGPAAGRSTALPLYQPGVIAVPLKSPQDVPFFEDRREKGHLYLQSSPNTPAVVAGVQAYEIAILAPFKRLAFILALSLSSLIAIVVLIRMYCALRRVE